MKTETDLERGMRIVNKMLPASSELGKRLTGLLMVTMTEAQRMIGMAYRDDPVTRVLIGQCFTILMAEMGTKGWVKFDEMIAEQARDAKTE